ncbi:DUF4124 domain-containing protein [Isoalcanivorax indicus]|uniref:DUF4124 domain-containing protein n=1 Tax=Isoalcanivorax indicus TaxID=2202653 RepID=UPI0013C43A06|nr:DUF4124 domain-containing protein [Isoalcanivorax indicus]
MGRKGRTVTGSSGYLSSALALLWLLAPLTAPASALYRWQDHDGRWHFSDRAPDHDLVEDLSERYRQPDAPDIRIETRDYTLSPALRQRLELSITRIFTIYRQALSVTPPTDTPFDILLYGDAEAYRAYARATAPQLENPAGFFNGQTRRITALALPDHDALLRLITHECSHAISATQGGYVPIWLNEGLAEYFSQLQLYGMTAEVPVADHWLRQLRRQPLAADTLRRTVDAPPKDWQAAAGSGHSYAVSWSLVWFLMDSPEGRELLRTLLARVADDPRPLLHSVELIDAHWPGGFNALEQAWRQWLPRASGRHRY